ncbi:MAG: hypothetical protein A3A98_02575 [Candidatus Staskawiczbacteria bacterium RIFCSPLOWO2_01_FULL_40_39]|uniref:Uncharacterized protein n=1 Tax=Candidatus Staskawiczbacteria bacterium RIFCSPHIGHO2_01_FULL_39_25 TaxID=1802202 RepID=A0A1G2HP66_9BACT|nr:MAG: hypothetical protein A2730_02300 [Candidatus Staskawiczbacteria bacterium RIFCSPHIGHO2_01_FULL_39_25]OGZ73634.1 MAG: hypothetical protein A3A98_02575 [Candidatus Staskawiczbacteria bacterium RIFCSPLOWO2_01_FULL_40_39]OGZ74621.1 MAG: hypothetical protein A3I87_01650 [Candidatus Staskawiczbacteria bacterium RIFCSPLOWO2_02_FULL_39_8]
MNLKLILLYYTAFAINKIGAGSESMPHVKKNVVLLVEANLDGLFRAIVGPLLDLCRTEVRQKIQHEEAFSLLALIRDGTAKPYNSRFNPAPQILLDSHDMSSFTSMRSLAMATRYLGSPPEEQHTLLQTHYNRSELKIHLYLHYSILKNPCQYFAFF